VMPGNGKSNSASLSGSGAIHEQLFALVTVVREWASETQPMAFRSLQNPHKDPDEWMFMRRTSENSA